MGFVYFEPLRQYFARRALFGGVSCDDAIDSERNARFAVDTTLRVDSMADGP